MAPSGGRTGIDLGHKLYFGGLLLHQCCLSLIAADRVYLSGGYPDPPLLCNSFIFAFPVIFVEVPVPSEADPDLENDVIQTQVGQKSESLVPGLSACPHGQRPADLAVWLNLVERNGSEG